MKNINLKLFLITVMAFFVQSVYAQTVNITVTQAPCNGNGILTANYSGFTGPITVRWYVHNNQTTHTNAGATSDVLNNYAGGYVYVTVQGGTSGYAWDSDTGSTPVKYTVTTTPGVCPVQGTATASNISGGTAPYLVEWISKTSNTLVSTNNPASLPTDQYEVKVTDANGCYFSNSDSIQVSQQTNITYNIATTQANCTNGTATITNLTGGTTPYSYLWSNSSTANSINNLTMGSYFVSVTDAQGCTEKRYAYIQQSRSIGVNLTKQDPTCLQSDGAITAYGSGGVTPYTYLWNNNVTSATQTNLAAGSYNVKVTDAQGCIGLRSTYLSSSTPINVTYSTTPSSCTSPTGTASLSISGGTAPYNVQWSTTPVQIGTTALNLGKGTYTFIVTDANGCIRTGTVYVPWNSNLTASVSSTNATCIASNGSATATVTGGATPYTYAWSNSGTTASINNLSAGYYSVTVTDNNGCALTKGRSVGTSSPVQIGLNTTNTSCIYSSTGTITAVPWGGTAPYSFNWSNGGTTPNINNLPTGQYRVNVTDANGCKATKYTRVGYNPNNNSCYCTITGVVYHDVNNNCVKDANEPGIPNIRINCTGNMGSTFTDANGVYSFKVPTGSYTLSETVLGMYPLASCQSNSVVVNVTAGPNCTHTVNFANSVNPIHDIHTSIWNINYPVPGYVYNQRILIKNNGTVTESNVNAGYKPDGQVAGATFTPGGYWAANGTAHYKISNNTLSLAPNAALSFKAAYLTPTNIPINTQLVYKDTASYMAPISNWNNDYSPWNNVSTYKPIVKGSYDPNFKEVQPAGVGDKGIISPNDTTLQYMVHFQNLGNYKAQNIFILDTLDDDLDWSTFRPIHESHKCNITISSDGVVRFQFDNIDLPHKDADEEASQGFVAYSIKTKKGLPLGTQFKNSAAIYFDFNEPVITNTTLNTIDLLSVEQIAEREKQQVLVYPNPTSDEFVITLHEESVYETIKVINTVGQLYTTQKVTGVENKVNMSKAAPGIYFVILQGNGQHSVQKIEKL